MAEAYQSLANTNIPNIHNTHTVTISTANTNTDTNNSDINNNKTHTHHNNNIIDITNDNTINDDNDNITNIKDIHNITNDDINITTAQKDTESIKNITILRKEQKKTVSDGEMHNRTQMNECIYKREVCIEPRGCNILSDSINTQLIHD